MQRTTISVLTTATICLLAGNALGQSTYGQGTIDRQRPRLDDSTIAPTTNGWLNDSQTPRFWAWKLNTSVNDTYKHANMQRWIQHQLWGSSLSGGTINTTSLSQQAQVIADEIVNRYNSSGNDAIANGEYAICLLGLQQIDLHDNALDNLNDSVLLWDRNASPQDCNPWSTFLSYPESPSRASPWRSNGVALADSAITYLTDQIVAKVAAQGVTFPAPLRIFFDEERNRQHGMSSWDNLGEIESIATDTTRRSTETLYGNYDLWASSSPTVASIIIQNAPLANFFGWNSACTNFSPNVQINASGTNPGFDHEFFPIYSFYNSMLFTSNDGTLGAAIDHPLNTTAWGNFKWSNYATSGYYSPSYPLISRSRRGAINPGWAAHEGYGWLQNSFLGTANIQSPVLYPPSDYQESEVGDETGSGINETEGEAWLRLSRMQLDHAIFSFTDLDTLNINAPRHIAPWVTRVGTIVSRPNIGDDFDITTKDNVRDIVALSKAKGVNEILFWGNPGAEFLGKKCDNTNADSQYNWDATNDLLSQVYEYTLNRVWFNTESRYLSADDVESMTFSEEHALDLNPSTSSGTTKVQFSAEFDIGSITTLGDQYTVVSEVLDGGGPWASASYTLDIYNYKTKSYQTITDLPIERYSNSTRRTVFSDSDSDGYANDWSRSFDDEALAGITTVYDRKKINAWNNFTLPIGSAQISNYTQSGKMKVRITATHTAPIPVGQSDPLRVDLVQLYETECDNNNITAAPQPLLGDINGDQQVDATDLMKFMQDFVSNPSSDLDLNSDGQVDINDIRAMNNLIRE